MSAGLISRRFAADGRPAVPLSSVQLQARKEILAKLKDGTYQTISVDCPGCKSDSKRLLAEKDAAGIPMNTSICLSCGLVYASHRLDDLSLSDFYEHENLRLDRGVTEAEEFLFNLEDEKGEILFQFLEAQGLLADRRGALVVEIGCGAGGNLLAFRTRGFAVAGFDVDPAVVKYGAARAGLDLHHGDVAYAVELLAGRGQKPSLVIYEQSLEHFQDPAGELARMRRLVGEKTLLFIGVPGLRNVGPHYRFDFLNYLQPGHLVHFERKTLCDMLKAQGYRPIVATEEVRAVFQLDPNGPSPNPRFSPATAEAMVEFLVEAERTRRRLARQNMTGKLTSAAAQLFLNPAAFTARVKDRVTRGRI